MEGERSRVMVGSGESLRDPDYSYGTEPQREEMDLTASPVMGMPLDPVLRQALIDKGILTPEDLRAAEDKIRAVSAAFNR